MDWYKTAIYKDSNVRFTDIDQNPSLTPSQRRFGYQLYNYLKSLNQSIKVYHGTGLPYFYKALKDGYLKSPTALRERDYKDKSIGDAKSREDYESRSYGKGQVFVALYENTDYVLRAAGETGMDGVLIKINLPIHEVLEIKNALINLGTERIYNELFSDIAVNNFVINEINKNSSIKKIVNDLVYNFRKGEFGQKEFTVNKMIPIRYIETFAVGNFIIDHILEKDGEKNKILLEEYKKDPSLLFEYIVNIIQNGTKNDIYRLTKDNFDHFPIEFKKDPRVGSLFKNLKISDARNIINDFIRSRNGEVGEKEYDYFLRTYKNRDSSNDFYEYLSSEDGKNIFEDELAKYWINRIKNPEDLKKEWKKIPESIFDNPIMEKIKLWFDDFVKNSNNGEFSRERERQSILADIMKRREKLDDQLHSRKITLDQYDKEIYPLQTLYFKTVNMRGKN